MKESEENHERSNKDEDNKGTEFSATRLQTDESKVLDIDKQGPEEPFKKPLFIIGPQRGKIVKGQNKFKIKIGPVKENDEESIGTLDSKKDTECSESKLAVEDIIIPKSSSQNSKPSPPLQYEEPDWGGLPSHDYNLEELKSGTIIKSIDLSKKSFSVFGRLECCDIPMLHPTVSRYHAVLQYRSIGDEKHEPGFYIYDLGSSLGTFLNKQKLKPKTFTRMKVGHVLKIGCSTRMFIMQGPEDDEEPESELTVTELKQQYNEKLAKLEAEEANLKLEEEQRIKKEEERGIDWGMGEDADEETDLTENPYASTQNEELYLDDPKKTLRGWFEREGEELNYDVEEKGFGHFVCRVELPVDNGIGGNLVAEASVKGKKKEAVVQAALEACRLLDRQGLLRQATQESKKRAAKDWEAVDFYDSDEDNFLDRTGHVEKKREQRMAQSGKLEKEVETYDSLLEKYGNIVKELEETENKLNDMLTLATRSAQQSQEEDDLDVYMSTLSEIPADKIEIKRVKDTVARLRTEEEKMRKLVNLARPTELPEYKPSIKSNVKKPLFGIFGKKCHKKRPEKITALPLETTQHQASDVQEEFDEDEEKPVTEEIKPGEDPKLNLVLKRKRSRVDRRCRPSKMPAVLIKEDDEDFSNCTWTPPVGQTGDGRTSLNDKFGY